MWKHHYLHILMPDKVLISFLSPSHLSLLLSFFSLSSPVYIFRGVHLQENVKCLILRYVQHLSQFQAYLPRSKALILIKDVQMSLSSHSHHCNPVKPHFQDHLGGVRQGAIVLTTRFSQNPTIKASGACHFKKKLYT